MNAEGSVTLLLQRLKAGEQEALQKLWEVYFERLVRFARKKLQGTPRQVTDEEDLALSVFNGLHLCVSEGRFPRLHDRDDLWQVLVVLTQRKAANLTIQARAQKRGGGQVCHASALDQPGEDEGRAFLDLISREPDPSLAAEVAEECRRLLGLLPGPLRDVAVWKMEGHTNEEIADKLGRSPITADRKIDKIREIWEKTVNP